MCKTLNMTEIILTALTNKSFLAGFTLLSVHILMYDGKKYSYNYDLYSTNVDKYSDVVIEFFWLSIYLSGCNTYECIW